MLTRPENVNVPPADARLQQATAFLERILPQEGFKCAYVVHGERKWNQFFKTHEALARFELQQDSRGDTVYHACSTFKRAENDPRGTPPAQRRLGRTQHNVFGAQAFLLDLDVGEAEEGKAEKYPTQRAAFDAVLQFAKDVDLPEPMIVNSGAGLHVYWPLVEALDPETWKRYAEGLKALCAKHGLHADPTRTADPSSVLRTPETRNRKTGREVLPVKLLKLVKAEPLAKFDALRDAAPEGAVTRRDAAPKPLKEFAKWIAGLSPSFAARLQARVSSKGRACAADLVGGIIEYAPAWAEEIARGGGCGQIAALRDKPGTVSEPLWHAAIGVLVHCVDGKERAHEWAAPEWHAVIDEKFERLAGFGPTTCAKFADLNRDGCAACKYRDGAITSPIKLGERPGAAASGPYDEIEELNARYFVTKVGGKSLIAEFVPPREKFPRMLSLMSVDAFSTWLANRKIAVRDHQGNERVKPLAKAWLEHPRRRQYESLELDPNGPAELPNGSLNLWRGFGIEPREGEWPLLAKHVHEVLADDDPGAADYILRWTAWSLQHPGDLAEAALVLRGGKGSGKGVFGNLLAKVFGEHGLHIFHQGHLTGNFNGHLRSCLFLFADEAFWAGDKKGESVLKGLVTERMLAIEQKGVDVIPCPNRLHVLMAANADWVVPASHDERRFAVFDVSDKYTKGGAAEHESKRYFDALHGEIKNGGAAAMLYDMLNYQLGDWHPRQVYETDGLRRQKEQSMPPIEQWFDELLQDGRLPGLAGLPGSKRLVQTRALMMDVEQRAPRLRHYLTDTGLGIFLRRQGCISVRSKDARGWQFPPLAEMRAAWARRYAGRVWDAPEQQDWQ